MRQKPIHRGRKRSMRLGKVLGLAAMAAALIATRAPAADLIGEWSTIQMPAAPELKQVTVDPKTTALLLFDFMKENCGARPRCVEDVPKLKALDDKARAAKMLVAYTFPNNGEVIDPSIAPKDKSEVVDQ